jgi:DNA-binding CsgD family transcriptional regulator
MVSIFDRDGTTPAAQRMLENERGGIYYLSYVPVQMRVVDHREVYLQGPEIDGEGSVMCLTSARVLDAALRYWQAVLRLAEPCRPRADRVPDLSSRQRQIMELLRQGMADARVAQVLGVSTRTVRYEIAAVMDELGARSRFAAGLLYAEKLLHGDRPPSV